MSAIDRRQPKRVGRRRFGLGRKSKESSEDPARAAMLNKLVVVAVPTPEPHEHEVEGVVVHAPPHLQRFDKATFHNPRIGGPVPPGSQPVAYTMEHYSPQDYAEKGKGAQHVKQSTDREDIEKLVEKRDSGSLQDTAEPSHAPRDYTEITYKTPGGKRIRRHRRVSEFV